MKFSLKQERLCKEGFLKSYLEYTGKQESPQDFHFWLGLSNIACCLRKNCWTQQGYFKVYPNLYVLLVGKSAVVRKSTALGIALSMLTEVLGEELNTFSQKGSTESFIHYLAELTAKCGKSEAVLHVSEFATLIGKCKNDPQLLETLTDYYDCPDSPRSYSTLSRGIEKIHGVCLNLQAGSTVDWLQSSLPANAIGGGFWSRMLPVRRDEPGERNAFPILSPEEIRARECCVNDLYIISKLKGEFTWTKEARSFYDDWYCGFLDEEQRNSTQALDGYYGRKGTTVLKLAMILSASYDSTLQIQEGDIQTALKLLSENEKYAKDLVSELNRTEVGETIEKVRNLIKREKKVGHSDLMRRVGYLMDKEGLRRIIETLQEGDEIGVERIGYRAAFYVWKGK